MQRLRLLTLLVTITSSIGSSSTPIMSLATYYSEDDEEYIYNDDYFLPRTPNEEYTFSGYIYYRGRESLQNTTVHARFYNKYYLGEDDWYSSIYAFEPKEITYRSTVRYTFTIPNVIFLGDSEVRVDIGLYNVTSRTYYCDRTIRIGCKKYGTYNTKDYQNSDLSFMNICSASGILKKEIYKLNHLKPFINIDSFYRFDISSLELLYDGISEITASSIFLSFLDKNNFYPHINKDENGNTIVPLSLIKGKFYTFEMNNLYVDPISLDMSSTYMDGYRKTKYLFLPKNSVDKFDNYKFTLNINGLGPNEINIIHEFEVDFNTLLIGPCDKAKYCIIGGRL